ncbi:MAG TPA: hypothetical protein VNA14_01000 [Mycobacteriales bacterium]|nr:hypothetical protein [Mycobacteriales bacterium]
MNRVVHMLAAVTALVLAAGCGGSTDPLASADSGAELVGLFRVTAGRCAGGQPAGSYFRMLQPNGKPEAGPYVINGDSACSDKTVTALRPGRDGGLRTGGYQPLSSAAFDAGGNGTAAAVVEPQKWFAVAFAISSNEQDPQTGRRAPVPRVQLDGTALTGDVSALGASWNGQHFNQGAPKPGGERPGMTVGPTGTYDASTGAYSLEWSSQIVGGPFNNFTGVWHLEGTFVAA